MNSLRIGGIASGFDTEQIIRDLMRIEHMKADKLYQEKQVLEWKKEDFRAVINKVRAFRDTYFDLLNPQTNLMSPATLKNRLVSSGDAGIVTAQACPDAVVGELVFEVIQSAAAAKAASREGVSIIRSNGEVAENITIKGDKNTVQVTLNGKTKEITVSHGDYTLENLCGELQNQFDAAFGEGRITVKNNASGGEMNGGVSFETEYASDQLTLVSSKRPDGEDVLSVLQIANGAANRLLLNETLEAVSAKLKNGPLVFGEEGEGDCFTFKINDVEISVEKTDTLGAVFAKINASGAGVHAGYDTFSDTLTVKAEEIGNFRIGTDEKGLEFFEAFGIVEFTVNEESGGCYIGDAGREAIFKINGIEGSRPGNIFTIDGITYNIQTTAGREGPDLPPVKISVSLDVEGIAKNIEKFVEDYNALIDEINTQLRAEVFRDFPPLTAEQKESMKEKEVEMWEEKARSGLLRRESSLENMLRQMREALYTAVDGVHILDIGLETSKDYRDQGKLVLKNGGSALRAALAEDPDKVVALFTKRPDIGYSPDLTAAERRERFQDAGLAHRLSDILNDNIRTTRDKSGRKGTLLERAGIEGDVSEFRNFFDREIGEINKRIDRVNLTLLRKEEQYYRQFTAMEKALQQLYAQGDWLMMQLGQFQS